MLYTVVPLEQVLEGIEQLETPKEIEVDGLLMQVETLPGDRFRIVRLISPQPGDYLGDRYAPGSVIRATW